MVFGYAYPAYECFKTVELNKPEIQQLQFWCQYWYMHTFYSLSITFLGSYINLASFHSKHLCRIIVAALTIFERIGDALVSW